MRLKRKRVMEINDSLSFPIISSDIIRKYKDEAPSSFHGWMNMLAVGNRGSNIPETATPVTPETKSFPGKKTRQQCFSIQD